MTTTEYDTVQVNVIGQQGPRGATWFEGATDPDSGSGADGDLYLQTDDGDSGVKGDVWVKADSAWSVSTNIMGTVNYPTLIAVDATDTSLRSAISTISSSGSSGTILLPDATITLTEPLPLISGVEILGVRPRLSLIDDNVPDNGWDFAGGSVLQGDGTFPCFQANDTDQASPADPYDGNAVTGAILRNIGFDNFTRAVSVGAVNNIGLLWGELDTLIIRNCSDWGVHLANFMHTRIHGIWTHLCQNAQRYAALSDGATLMPGNSTIDMLFNILPYDGRDNRLCRGLVFDSDGSSASLNEIYAWRLQHNCFNKTLLSVTATFTSGSADIAVPDGTKFAAYMPVVFTTTGYGVTENIVYVVKSVSGDTIQIGTKFTDSALVPTGSGDLTLETYGMANLEIAGRTSDSRVHNCRFLGVDVEGDATAALYLEGLTADIIDVSELPSNGSRIVARYFAGGPSCGATETQRMLILTPNALPPSSRAS